MTMGAIAEAVGVAVQTLHFTFHTSAAPHRGAHTQRVALHELMGSDRLGARDRRGVHR